MRHLASLALFTSVLIGACATRGSAQQPRSAHPVTSKSGQPSFPAGARGSQTPRPGSFVRAVPPGPPPAAPPPHRRESVDSNGRRFTTVYRYVPVWDAAQGHWSFRVVRYSRPAAPGATLSGQPKSKVRTYSAPVSLGGNQIGGGANRQDGQPGAQVRPEAAPVALGGNAVGQPSTSNAQTAAASLNSNSVGPPPLPVRDPSVALAGGTSAPANPSPPPPMPPSDPLFAANLGIYYVKVPYGKGTFGAKLTSSPVAKSPASQLPLDVGDIIFMLDGQRFTSPDDLLKHADRTSVNYIDASTNTQKSGIITIPQPQNE